MGARIDGALRRVARTLTLGPAVRVRRQRSVGEQPTAEAPPTRFTVLAAVVAVCLPVVVGVALIPLRGTLDQSLSLIMVLPVVFVAVIAGVRPAIVSAASAALSFDVLFTLPHYQFTIDDPDDLVETIVLLVVGATVGALTEVARRSAASARIRRRELSTVADFLTELGVAPPEALIEHARLSIIDLLAASDCRWHPGYGGTTAPVLTAAGGLVAGGPAGDRSTTTAKLPPSIEIPVGRPPTEHGRFVVRTSQTEVSIEERRTAATIAEALGRALHADGVG